MVALIALVAAIVVGARMALTSIVARPGLIVRILSRKTGRTVRVKAVAPFWNGIHPGLILTGAEVQDASGHPLLTVPRLKISLAWSALLFGQIAPYSLKVTRPVLTVQLRRSGVIDAGGIRIPVHATNRGDALKVWLLDQHDLSIQDAAITWIDRLHGEHIPVHNLNLLARNRFRHHVIDVSADFPRAICAHCSFFLNVSGAPRSLARVSGEAYAHLEGVHIARLPWMLRHYLPAGSGGLINVQVWSRWKRGAPVYVKGTLRAHDLTVPASRWASAAHIKLLSGGFGWRQFRSAWTFEIQRGRMQGEGPVWKFGHLLARVGMHGSELQVSRLNLDQVSWVLAHVRTKGPLFTALQQIDPDGLLRNVKVHLVGPLASPQGFWLDADAAHLTATAYGPYPGFDGINGAIHVYDGGGAFVIHSMKGQVFWPRYFKKPLTVDAAAGDLSWVRAAGGWRIHSRSLSLRTSDGALGTGFTISLPATKPASLVMHVTATGVNLSRIRQFYQVIPKPGLRRWLLSSLQAGVIAHGELHVKGNLARFPFASGGGQFDARADVTGGRFKFLKRWPALHSVQAHLAFHDGQMSVDGSAQLGKLQVVPLKVGVSDFSRPSGAVVEVHGFIHGRIDDMLTLLRAGGAAPAPVLAHLTGHGQGVLQLGIEVPIGSPKTFTLNGRYQTANASLSLTGARPFLSHIQGDVRFNRQGLVAGRINANLFGGPASARVRSVDRVPVLQLQGQTSISALAPVLPTLAHYAKGSVPWRAAVRMVPGIVPIIQFSGDLKNTDIRFPRPLYKRAGVAAHLEIETVHSGKNSSVIAAHIGRFAAGQLWLRRFGTQWSIPRGRVTLGGTAAPMPRTPGITAVVFAHRLDAGHWLRVGSVGHGGLTVSRLIINTAHLVFLGRDFGAMHARLDHTVAGWRGTLSGADADGVLEYDSATKPAIVRMTLKRLVIPKAPPPLLGPTSPFHPIEPFTLPEVVLKSASLEDGSRALGAVDFLGLPERGGWHIAYANFTRPEGTLRVSGDWYGGKKPRTRLSVVLDTRNLGQTLAAFAVPGQVAGGVAHAAGSLAWVGAPADFSLDRLHGSLTFAADNGRFKRLHQGAGKLLGIFDIHSIVRYLTLDFSTLFKSGYVFDHIRGNLQIRNGDAHTNGITVTGPSANLSILGDANLASQQFNLQVSVDPRLSDTLTLAGASLFASPLAGAAVLLMQRVFRKQISAGTRIVYLVKGPWSRPVIQEKPDHDHD